MYLKMINNKILNYIFISLVFKVEIENKEPKSQNYVELN